MSGIGAAPLAHRSSTSLIYDRQTFTVSTDWKRADGRTAAVLGGRWRDTNRARRATSVYRSRMSATAAASPPINVYTNLSSTASHACHAAADWPGHVQQDITRRSSSSSADVAAAAASSTCSTARWCVCIHLISTDTSLTVPKLQFPTEARYLSVIFTYADGSREGRVFSGVCVFVCLSVSRHDISKTDAARITELDTDMFHDEFWK